MRLVLVPLCFASSVDHLVGVDRRSITSGTRSFAQLLLSGLPADSPPHRAGLVSILGVPNVGKSTLLNHLLGERLSIATPRAQTTRKSIVGIDNGENHQIVYVDTPGIISTPQYKLQEGMMKFVYEATDDIDAILLLVDIFNQPNDLPSEKFMKRMRSCPAALIVLLNKVDLLDDQENATWSQSNPEREARRMKKAAERKAKLGSVEVQRWRKYFPEADVLPISAKNGDGVDELQRRIIALLPDHEEYYPKEDDHLSDMPERFFAAEFVREAIFEQYDDEIPYSCECVVQEFKDSEKLLKIILFIFVSHDSQKGILIGKGGQALKKMGMNARRKLEKFFHKKVYLQTKVKVRRNWREDPKSLEEFGYSPKHVEQFTW